MHFYLYFQLFSNSRELENSEDLKQHSNILENAGIRIALDSKFNNVAVLNNIALSFGAE